MSYFKKYNKYRLKQLAGSLPTQEDKVLSILRCCAEKEMFREVKPFRNLKRLFRNDDQLLALNNKNPYQGTYDKTYLMAGAFTGNVERINRLLDNGDNIDAINQLGETALMIACKNGRNDVVILLLNRGANLTLVYPLNHHSPFMVACKYCNVDVIRRFIHFGANVNDVDNSGNTTLMFVSKANNLDAVRLLIENGVNINALNNENKTALNLACEGGRMDIINLLVTNGATLDLTERGVRHALYNSIENNNMPVFTFLIDRGVNPNSLTCPTSMTTVLMDACQHGRLEMVRVLVEHGANVNHGSGIFGFSSNIKTNKSMLNYVLSKIDISPEPQKEIYRNIARCLNDHGADVNNVDDIGMTALMYAIQFEHRDIVEYLCAHGAVVNGKMQLLPPPLPPVQPVQVVPPPMPIIYQPGYVIPEEEDLYA